MGRYRRAVAVAVLAGAIAWANALGASEWSDRTIDGYPEFAMSDSALQLDASGRPHLFVAGDRVYHHWFDGAGWRSEVVDPRPRAGILRAATGPSGEFHLVYAHFYRFADSDPQVTLAYPETTHATNLSGHWEFEAVPEIPRPPGYPFDLFDPHVTGFAVDASHHVHLLAAADGIGSGSSRAGPEAGRSSRSTRTRRWAPDRPAPISRPRPSSRSMLRAICTQSGSARRTTTSSTRAATAPAGTVSHWPTSGARRSRPRVRPAACSSTPPAACTS